jgi:hypothetical protein
VFLVRAFVDAAAAVAAGSSVMAIFGATYLHQQAIPDGSQ